MRRLIYLLVFLAVLAGGVMGALYWEDMNFSATGPSQAETTVLVKPGSSTQAIARSLEGAHVIDNALLFRLGVMRRGTQAALKAGEYVFAPGISMSAAMQQMIRHDVVTHRITVAEGLSTSAVLAIIKAAPILEGDVGEAKEGTLLPETYTFERGTTRKEILERMRKAQTALIAELWAKRKEGLPISTPEEAVNLASIVEKETGVAEERPHIASVFVNRLKKGMKLESDPTIIYGLTKGEPLGHPLRQSELAAPNPYSTYQIEGLPPTPICNPGRDAIAAVLNPLETDDLFFVATGNGGSVFAATLAEHQKNVAALRHVEQSREAAPAPRTAVPEIRRLR